MAKPDLPNLKLREEKRSKREFLAESRQNVLRQHLHDSQKLGRIYNNSHTTGIHSLPKAPEILNLAHSKLLIH